MYALPDGTIVGEGHAGPKVKLADSQKEYARRLQLVVELRAGLIQSLDFQRTYWLHGRDGSRVCRFVADFVYVRKGVRVVEDVKPMRPFKKKGEWARDTTGNKLLKPFATPAYFLKKKFMLAEYNIAVVEF